MSLERPEGERRSSGGRSQGPRSGGRWEARTLMMLSGARFMFRFLILTVSWWAVLQVRRYLLISSLGNLVPSKCFSPRANKLRKDPWPQSRRLLFCGTRSPRSSPQRTPQCLHASFLCRPVAPDRDLRRLPTARKHGDQDATRSPRSGGKRASGQRRLNNPDRDVLHTRRTEEDGANRTNGQEFWEGNSGRGVRRGRPGPRPRPNLTWPPRLADGTGRYAPGARTCS